MLALGATCGVGSMLIGARNAGFSILGNIEWRDYYHVKDENGRNTFTENFPGSFMVKNISKLNPISYPTFHSALINKGIDLMMGHPDCGNYSTLSQTRGDMEYSLHDPGDIPIFVNLINRLKPRFFVQDNLPKSLISYPIEKWAKALPEYDLFPEWISNWGYGNVQKTRNRFFMIGALKSEKFSFYAQEQSDAISKQNTLRKTLSGMNPTLANNEKHDSEGKSSKCKGMVGPNHMTYGELSEYMLNKVAEGRSPTYITCGRVKSHAGTYKFYKDKHALTLTAGGSFPISPWTGYPFSIRERARIQGCPDDFVFYGMKYQPDGAWRCSRNQNIVKQVTKFMPVQFCNFVAQQIADHIKGVKSPTKSVRYLTPNNYIDEAKIWYCKNFEYADKKGACNKCWINEKNCPRNR